MSTTNHESACFSEAKLSLIVRTTAARINFFREEFLKHRQCLEYQRECYSEKAITDVEVALTRLMLKVDRLCTYEDGDQLVSKLLRKIDRVTRLSASSDPKKIH